MPYGARSNFTDPDIQPLRMGSHYQSDPGLGLQNQNQNSTSPDITDVRPGKRIVSRRIDQVVPTDVRPHTMISDQGLRSEMTFSPNGLDQPTPMSNFPVPESGNSTTMSGMGRPGSTQGTSTHMGNFGMAPDQDWPKKAPTEVNPGLSGNFGIVHIVSRQQEPTIVGYQTDMVMSHKRPEQGQGKGDSVHGHLYADLPQQQNYPPQQQSQPPPQHMVNEKSPPQSQGQQQLNQQPPGHPQQQPQQAQI
jgi:hypothetical protein